LAAKPFNMSIVKPRRWPARPWPPPAQMGRRLGAGGHSKSRRRLPATRGGRLERPSRHGAVEQPTGLPARDARRFRRSGEAFIHALELDGRPVSMQVVLRAAPAAFTWKTAYDEALGDMSPNRLFEDYTQAFLENDQIDSVDSCAYRRNELHGRLAGASSGR
jgi:Acetyltransferase (GNAT) domain